ncbi:uncharacterized protein MJAP1_000413 [Malassezia japonica]|uniref:Uncharacterized protein n=1 Tax=Malassezia japonica TaxID=223818 RepID=A0AAF0J917_9BASI|nr:uncharacterized protein MJAP1_000413 [Malassezia japonica]WFD37469.1 hypothetical protein MJAP1_000413 [Malassezia japonica]
MTSTGADATRESVLRHRHAREADGAPPTMTADMQVPRGHEDDDFIVLRPPHRPKDCKPTLLTPLVNVVWRVYTGLSGIMGMILMEPQELAFMLFLYALITATLVMAVLQFPAYFQLAHRRLHYYITGE